MNELVKNGDKRMTVKELSNALGVSERVIQLEIKRQFPGIVQNGKTTYIDEVQSVAIKVALQRHHNLEGTFEQAECCWKMRQLNNKSMFILLIT